MVVSCLQQRTKIEMISDFFHKKQIACNISPQKLSV